MRGSRARRVRRHGLTEVRDGGWRISGWAPGRVVAGITDRRGDAARLLRALEPSAAMVEAQQVHGSSIAVIARAPSAAGSAGGALTAVPGADALLTSLAGMALLVRTADCLPIFFADPRRGLIGIAHAGWRGLAGGLAARVVAAFRHTYHTRGEELWVAIGPAIRACCYEVGAEFVGRFGPFVQVRGGRRTCDLVGVAVDQLRRCGVRPGRILDTRACTACEVRRWHSLRRDGPAAGRVTSLILRRP